MKQAERYLSDGVHPRVIVEGFEVGIGRILSQPIRVLLRYRAVSEEPAIVATVTAAPHHRPHRFVMRLPLPPTKPAPALRP